MGGKFAILRYAANTSEISVRLASFLKSNKRIMDWYVNKFLPLTITQTDICHVPGYEIVLPFTKEGNKPSLEKALEKVSIQCRDLGVSTIISPKSAMPDGDFFVPKGNFIKFFFIKNIIEKYSKSIAKGLDALELVIIEGSLNNTTALIKFIYNEFNYLGVILESNTKEDYEQTADFIFDDCGLNLSFGQRGSYLLKEADIIINLSENEKGYDSHIKEKACYIELSQDKKKVSSMALKRNDVFIVDEFNVELDNKKIPIRVYEMIMYAKCKDFLRFVLSNGKYGSISAILDELAHDKACARNLNI